METKICNKCGCNLTQDNLVYKGLRKGVRVYRGHCSNCDNKTDRILKQRKRRYSVARRLRNEFNSFKETLSCKDCGLSFKSKAWLCDFHHLDPKIKDREGRGISYLVQLNTKDRLERELSKCVPLCSNCHRTRHHYDEGLKVFKESNTFKKVVAMN